MRVSTRVEYGVIALVDIALQCESGASVTALEIAERQGISKKYLEQILPLLKQGGLIRAQKGLGGGYTLSKDPLDITVYDILNSLDTAVLEDMEYMGNDGTGELRSAVNDLLWGKMNMFLKEFTKNKTLSELMKECEDRMIKGWDMYVI